MAHHELGLPHTLSPAVTGFASRGPDDPGGPQATTSNIAGAMTPICHWTVGQGEGILLLRPDRFTGELELSVFRPRLKLRDNGGIEIAADSRLLFAIRGPTDYAPIPLVEVAYGVWHGLTYAEQTNRDNAPVLSVGFPVEYDGDALLIDAGSSLVLLARADRSVSFAPAAGARLELPARRTTGTVVM